MRANPAAAATTYKRMPAPARKSTSAPAAKAAALSVVETDPAALLARYIDELGQLEAELVQARAKLRRVETLRELIRRQFEKKPAAKSFEARGTQFFATLGACAWQSEVDYEAVQKAIGLKAYAAIARPTLKALEETLPPDVLARVVTYGYRGARPLKTFEIG
jgi:pantoate kinase